LHPFPLTVMALATFLVIFTLLMARLTASSHLASGAPAGAVAVTAIAGEAGASAVSTRTSGGGATAIPAAIPAVAEGSSSPAGPTTIVTRTSGAGAARDE